MHSEATTDRNFKIKVCQKFVMFIERSGNRCEDFGKKTKNHKKLQRTKCKVSSLIMFKIFPNSGKKIGTLARARGYEIRRPKLKSCGKKMLKSKIAIYVNYKKFIVSAQTLSKRLMHRQI